MSITNKSKEELIKEALENQYQLTVKEATIAKQKEQSQSSIVPPVQSSFRQYTGKPVNIQNKGPKYEMKITLFNRGFERDMM